MENILIDTDIVIEYLRSKDKSLTMLVKMVQAHNLFLSAISEFELHLGASTKRHHTDLEILFSEIEVLPFDFGCGGVAAAIWKDVRSKHQHVDIKDIFIASVAVHNDIWLQTFNLKHFQAISGLKLWRDY